MDKRFFLFITLSFGILLLNAYVNRWMNPPPAQQKEVAKGDDKKADKKADDKAGDKGDEAQNDDKDAAAKEDAPAEEGEKPEDPAVAEKGDEEPAKPAEGKKEPGKAEEKPVDEEKPAVAVGPQHPLKYIALGSADPNDPYRLLVTLCSRGATVSRVELNSPRYRSLMGPEGTFKDLSGYLGSVVVDENIHGKGCPVQVVGKGTPAAKAGIQPGDLILSIDGRDVTGSAALRRVLAPTRPGNTVTVKISRGGAAMEKKVTLTHRPMDVIRPEGEDPQSFLLTLNQWDKQDLTPEKDDADRIGEEVSDKERLEELPGVHMFTENWEIVASNETKAVFRFALPEKGLEFLKTYQVVKVPAEAMEDPAFRGYHIEFKIEVRNIGKETHNVAYRLDGPNGLPIEGWWYANRVSRNWGSGFRDFIISRGGQTPEMVNSTTIADGKLADVWRDMSVTFVGIDAQYFSSILIPKKKEPGDIWFARTEPLLVGSVEKGVEKKANTTCRVVSIPTELKPDESRTHSFDIFVGPKNTDILAGYGLDELVYYGWFSWAAKPMVKTLHFFHYFTRNYALAIILLTVLVRLCMYPLSRKQVASAAKMQELQPELKKIQEKYKKDLEARSKAQQELFRKHNYNPLMGCLPIFVQLPIFIALYRSLMVDIELRQQPLIAAGLGWCTNLAAPDMLFNWSGFMPAFVNNGVGIFGLGPYFNLLPIITIVLFIWQQKMMMPPAMDEQQAMQQKMMKYMMLFIGIMFFKVAAGLCLYFIATSLWSVAERKLLPKSQTKTAIAKEEPKDWKQARKDGGKKGGKKGGKA